MSHEHDDVVLTLVALSDDQTALVLADEDGQTFRITVDDATSVIASRSPALTAHHYAEAADARHTRSENAMPDVRAVVWAGVKATSSNRTQPGSSQ